MQLPNPFASSVVSVKPSYILPNHVQSSNATINPGPGLPSGLHAPSVDYSSYSLSAVQLDHQNRKQQSFGQSSYGRNGFSASQFLPFSCDRCDRSFKSKELLDAHISEHILCGIDGCPFVAHPKVVQKHIQMQHETGLAAKIMQLNSPQEIEKWREERKRNFPSAANVTRRQEEQKEKLERGEVLSIPKDKFNRNRNNQRGRGRGRGRGTGRADFTPGKSSKTNETSEPIPTSQPQKIPPSSVVNLNLVSAKVEKVLSDGEIDSDENKEIPKPTVERKVSSNPGSALANLMGAYASDSDSDSDQGPSPAKRTASDPTATGTKQIVGFPEKPVGEKVEINGARRRKNRGTGKSPRQKPVQSSKANLVRPKRLTLLQKLLQSEIVHERNVVLQCVHYIVQQQFFGVGQNSDSN